MSESSGHVILVDWMIRDVVARKFIQWDRTQQQFLFLDATLGEHMEIFINILHCMQIIMQRPVFL